VNGSKIPIVLSLDIWDTLLRRRVHPDQIKIFSQQRSTILSKVESISSPSELLGLRQKWEKSEADRNLSINFDDEYEIYQVLKKNLNLAPEMIQNIVEFEFELEKMNSYPDPEILETIASVQSHSKSYVIAISDFYFSSRFLRNLISEKFPDLHIDEVIVSCEVGFNKRNRLFSYLLDTRKEILPDNWIHVGDSILSDINGAKRFGIKTMHYEPYLEHSKRLTKEKQFQERVSSTNWLKSFPVTKKISLGLIGYTEYLRAEAIRLDAKVLFLEREGLILKSIFEKSSAENIYQLPDITFDSLAVSRVSIFAAAYSINPIKAVSKILFSYPNLSGKVFLQSLGVKEFSMYTKLEAKYSEFISDSINESLVKEYCFERLINAKKYLTTHIQEEKSYILADVGWLGSMQEYLTIIFPGASFHGVYLGLQEFSRLLRIGEAKSFIDPFALDGQKVLRNVRPIEMLFMPEGISGVIGYSGDGSVIRNPETSRKETPAEFIRIQNEIISLIPEMARLSKENLITLSEMRETLASGMGQFLREPPRQIVSDYLEAQHDETFGIGKRITHNEASDGNQVIKALVSFNVEKLREFFSQIGWVEASFFSLFKRLPTKFERRIYFGAISKAQTLARSKRSVVKLSGVILSKPSFLLSLFPIFRKSCKEIGIPRTLRKTRLFLRNLASSQTAYRNSMLEQLSPVSIIPTAIVVIDGDKEMMTPVHDWAARVFVEGKVVSVINATNLTVFDLPTSRISDVLAVNLSSSVMPAIEYRFPDAEVFNLNVESKDELIHYLNSFNLNRSRVSVNHSKNKKNSVAWIIPTLPLASGGHRGMFRMALEFEKHGYSPVFYVINQGNDETELKSRFQEHYYQNEIEIRAGIPDKFNEDFVVATAHYTLRLARTRTSNTQKVVYFVQDDEALFNPVSSTFFRARETYFEPETAILASGAWMSNRIETLTGKKVPYFDFPVDRNVYKSLPEDENRLENRTKGKQIVFYFKPDAERRMADLGLEVLRIVKAFVPEVRIVSFGSSVNPDLKLIDEHHGVFRTINEISDLYRKSHIGLVFSPTNPSLIPYEMSACGTVVVDYCEQGDQTKLSLCEEIGIQYSNASTNDLARKIIELLSSEEYFRSSQANALAQSEHFATPEISGQQAVKLFVNLMNKP
jgi:FMN phosphatase YigB (HAD superfamily)